MKLVPLSTNKWTSDTHFMVSDEDYDSVIQFKWYVTNDHANKGNYTAHYTVVRNATKEEVKAGYAKNMKLHRFIFELKKIDKTIVDHKNSWLDNTREGLRLTNNRLNTCYSKTRTDKKSGLPKGVYSKNNLSFTSEIKVNGRKIWLGTFSTPEEAHETYKTAAVKYFGEFARFE